MILKDSIVYGSLDVKNDLTFRMQLVSDIATGTAPLIIASTTKVSNLNVDQLDGYHAANATASIPISNGTVNTDLNADKLDGYHASNSTASVPISNGTLNTNLNADQLDGYHASNNTASVPISNGTVNTNLNADQLDGFDATDFARATYTLTAGENLVAGNLCYLKSDGKMWKTDCDAEATSIGLLAIANASINADATGQFIVRGTFTTTGLTTAATYYISGTAGTITATQPSTSGQIVRILGYALSTTVLWLNPSNDYIQIA